MIGAFFVKRTGSLSYVENVNTGIGIAYAAEVQGDASIWHGLELDYIRIRKEITIGTSSTGPYIKTGGAAGDVNIGTDKVNSGKILLTTGSVLSDWQAAGDVTKINGGKIYTGSVITSALAFVPLISSGGTGAIVATINASAEGIKIAGSRIQIDGTVTFSSGYDPTTKIAAGGAAADVNANITTISGGKITTNSITADRLNVASLSSITAIIGTIYTAASGNRIELNGTGVTLQTFDVTNNRLGTIAQGMFNSSSLTGFPYANLDPEGISIQVDSPSPAVRITAARAEAASGYYDRLYLSKAYINGWLKAGGGFQVVTNYYDSTTPTFIINSSGQLTKVNNVSPTAKYALIGDGTSFTPRLLVMSDLPAQTVSKIATTDASGYLTSSSVASAELFTPAYGELYDAVATSTITCDGLTYVKWTGSSIGNCKGVTGNTTSDDLAIDSGNGGKYLAQWAVSFKTNTTGDYYWTVNAAGSADGKSKKRINVATANIDYNVSGQAIISLTAGNAVNLGCYGSSGNIVTVSFANLTITKLSN